MAENKLLNNAVVIFSENGQMKLFSTDFNLDTMKELLKRFELRVPGRAYINKEGYWMFEPYHVGQNMPSVLAKEQVGQITAKRFKNMVNFTLSLPATMSKNQMILAVLEQYGNLVDALREGGLYEKLVNLQTVATEQPAMAA